MQNISDLSFHEFGNSEAFEEETDLNENYSRKTVRVNIHGQKVRGADLEWRLKYKFLSPKEYFESQLFIELKEMFSRKRKNDDLCHGDVHHYVCKYSRKKKYLPCPHQMKIIFPSDSQEVIAQEVNSHSHIHDPEIVDTSSSFQWSKAATDLVAHGIKSGATPKVILRSLRDHGCFVDVQEPSMMQLYNKISHLKKVLDLTESIDNTHELRNKIKEYSKIPDNDIESFVCYSNIQDDVESNEELRLVVIFTTLRTLNYLRKTNNLHSDATYRLNYCNFPVMILGPTNITTKFFPTMTVLSSHEDTEAWKEIYGYVHSENIHSSFRMSDGQNAQKID